MYFSFTSNLDLQIEDSIHAKDQQRESNRCTHYYKNIASTAADHGIHAFAERKAVETKIQQAKEV